MPELSRENLEKQSTLNTKRENLEVKKSIEIQEELIEESGLEPEEWIEKYGEKVREIIKKNPRLLNDKKGLKKELKKEITH